MNVEDAEQHITAMRWGFNMTIHGKKKTVFNAKLETVIESKMWKKRFQENRCIVPASARLEWQKVNGKSEPKYDNSVSGADLFGFAALWGNWTNPKTEQWEKTFSIFMTIPNSAMAPFQIASRSS